MNPSLLVALAAAVLVLIGAQGVRMLRVPVVDDLLETEKSAPTGGHAGAGPFTRLIDVLGARTQRLLVAAYGPRHLARLDKRLREAGRPEGLNRETFVQREAGFLVLALIVFALFVLNDQWLIGLAAFILFATWMQTWLAGAARRRAAEIDCDLTDFLDVLAVTVSAGLSFRAALDRVASHHDGALAEEMRATFQEMQLGVPRRDAFAALRSRTRSENVDAFVTALLQAEELGTPLADALTDISAEARRQHAQQVRQAAAKAQPKVSLVVTLTIVPAAIVLMMGGLVISNWDVFRQVLNV